MIDEDLYKIATDELNSGARKPEVWARACALASDDHDEARFLYTNLRVEEMLNTDGKQRTFSTSEQHRGGSVGVPMRIDAVDLEPAVSFGSELLDDEDSLDSTLAQVESSRAGVDSISSQLPTDELDSFEMDDPNAPASASGTDVMSDKVVELDDETMAELAALSTENAHASTVSSITGISENDDHIADDHVNKVAADSSENVSSMFGTSSTANHEQFLSQDQPSSSAIVSLPADEPSYQRQNNSLDVSNLEGDALSNLEDHDATAESAYVDANPTDAANAANDDAASVQGEIPTQFDRTDYSDTTQLIAKDSSIDATSALDTGVGRSFLVFNRHGALKGIKRGVSWPALFFTLPWLLSKTLFGTAFVYACLWLVSLGGLLSSANRWFMVGADASLNIKLWTGAFALLVIVGLFYLPFRFGNRWVAEKLQSRGFKYEGSVSAENKLDAVDRLIRYNQENAR